MIFKSYTLIYHVFKKANKNIQFILSGSSPRKILRSGANLLGGRALRHELYPLVYKEIPDFDLLRALNHGLLPRHYLSKNPEKLILVSNDPFHRQIGIITAMPWNMFLDKLWVGEIIV